MRRLIWLALTSVALLGGALCAHSAEIPGGANVEPPKLQTNPFSRPRDLASKRGPGPSGAGEGTAVGRELRAVLSGANGGLANIGGELIETGALHGGYLLMRIDRNAAIFMRGGAEIRVEIGEDLPNE